MALNLERDSVGVVIFGDYKQLAEGGVAKCTGKILEVPVGPELVGRVDPAEGFGSTAGAKQQYFLPRRIVGHLMA